MTARVRKAVIPAAGFGTRFLPATKAVPKELLPVVDKPAIQYVIEEAVAAGLTDVLVVTGRGKSAIEDHFDRVPELEQALAADGKQELLDRVRAPGRSAALQFVRQGEPRGLGHAVSCARPHVGAEPFAVLLPDEFFAPGDYLLDAMVTVQRERGGSVVALMEVPREEIRRYGAVAVEPGDAAGVVRVTGLVEKPPPERAPSTLAVIGRYLLTADVFDLIDATAPGHGGEIQLTDALARLTEPGQAGGPLWGVLLTGRRYDIGEVPGYLRAVVETALARDDVGPAFREWLRSQLPSDVVVP